MNTVKNGGKLRISEDGTVVVGCSTHGCHASSSGVAPQQRSSTQPETASAKSFPM
jgi:hypothetical protein